MISEGDQLLVRMKGGDESWVHIVVVLADADGSFLVLKTDRTIGRTRFEDNIYDEILLYSDASLPRSVRRDQAALDVDSADGRFESDEIAHAIAECKKRMRLNGKQRPKPRLPVEEPPAARRVQVEPGIPTENPGGGSWFVLMSAGSLTTGDEIDWSCADTSWESRGSDSTLALFKHEGVEGVCFYSPTSEAPNRLRGYQARCGGRDVAAYGTDKPIFAEPAGTPPAAEPEAFEDVRVLPVRFDTDGKRHRTLADSVPLYEEESFEDWPLTGDRSLLWTCQELRRQNLTWQSHHKNWANLSGVRKADRSVFEHEMICRALHHMTCYDQLSLPNSAGAESLNGRRMLIEHAHESSPDAPNYEGAEDFIGERLPGAGTLVDPKRISHVAARAAAKAKIMESQRKAAGEKGHWMRRAKTDKAGKGKDGAAKGDGPGGAAGG